MSLSLRSARYWFYLEDLMTGENRDVVTDPGGTEQDARNLLGGSWTDPKTGDLPWPVPAGGGHSRIRVCDPDCRAYRPRRHPAA